MKVRLEINQLNIHRPKRRWKLYFVIVAEHPTEPDKMVVTTVPNEPIKVTPNQNNEIHFDDAAPGSEGLLVLKRDMPAANELNVHCYVRHSRSAVRSAAQVLTDIQEQMGMAAMKTTNGILGTSNPWLVVSKSALPLIGQMLTKVPDRDMGFVSMFERFGSEFFDDGEVDRKKTGAYSSIVYSWSVEG